MAGNGLGAAPLWPSTSIFLTFSSHRPRSFTHAQPLRSSRSLWSSVSSRFSSSGHSANKDEGPAAAADQQQESNDAGSSGDDERQKQGEDASSSASAAAEMSPEELKAALTEAQTALDEERRKTTDLKDRLVRTLADMENLRERTARQVSEARQFAVQPLVKSMVDVADNLERAAGSVVVADVDGSSEIDGERAMKLLRGLREGVVMTDDMLMKILGKEGVTRFDPMGEPFDPNLHNALFQVPDATKEPGTVAVVVKKGYMLHDRAVRAADVGVVSKSD